MRQSRLARWLEDEAEGACRVLDGEGSPEWHILRREDDLDALALQFSAGGVGVFHIPPQFQRLRPSTRQLSRHRISARQADGEGYAIWRLELDEARLFGFDLETQLFSIEGAGRCDIRHMPHDELHAAVHGWLPLSQTVLSGYREDVSLACKNSMAGASDNSMSVALRAVGMRLLLLMMAEHGSGLGGDPLAQRVWLQHAQVASPAEQPRKDVFLVADAQRHQQPFVGHLLGDAKV